MIRTAFPMKLDCIRGLLMRIDILVPSLLQGAFHAGTIFNIHQVDTSFFYRFTSDRKEGTTTPKDHCTQLPNQR